MFDALELQLFSNIPVSHRMCINIERVRQVCYCRPRPPRRLSGIRKHERTFGRRGFNINIVIYSSDWILASVQF